MLHIERFYITVHIVKQSIYEKNSCSEIALRIGLKDIYR